MTENERARERAVRYLAHSARTENQVRRNLSEHEFSPEVIDDTIEYLKNLNYVDDLKYAQNFVEETKAKAGPRSIEAKLRRRGIAPELAANASAVSGEEQREAAQKLISKLNARYEGLPEEKRRQRIYAALARGGFDWEEVRGLFFEDED